MDHNLAKRVAHFIVSLFIICLFINNPAWAQDDSAVKPAEQSQSAAQPVGDVAASSDAATASDEQALEEDQPVQDDPSENFNRAMFIFNEKVDNIVLKPLATLYNKILPTPLNQGITNFFNNIRTVPTIANDILQLHFYQTLNDSWRLVINTTIGIGGLFDVATRMGLTPYTNDFGLTLARWGYQNSYYLVLPFFGPSSFRDGVSLFVDYYAFSVYPRIYPARTRYVIYGVGVVDRRAQLLQFQTVLEEAALDKYVFIRNAYLQRRSYEKEQNQNQGIISKTKTDEAPFDEEAAVPNLEPSAEDGQL